MYASLKVIPNVGYSFHHQRQSICRGILEKLFLAESKWEDGAVRQDQIFVIMSEWRSTKSNFGVSHFK